MLPSLTDATDADRAWLDDLRRAAYEPLFHATWGGWDEARHQRHFEATWAKGCIRIIEFDGRRVGMIQLLERGECVEVGEIQILPAHQNKGIGTRVLLEVLERAGEREVVLSTGLMNAGALRLYARLGFVERERTDTHVHLRCARPKR